MDPISFMGGFLECPWADFSDVGIMPRGNAAQRRFCSGMRRPHDLQSGHEPLTPISALSPLDGRYAAKLAALRPLMSEYGLMHRRVQVEVEWFIALSRRRLRRVQAAVARRAHLPAAAWSTNFSEADAQAIKDIEKTTNHDVKAVEYWIKSTLRGPTPSCEPPASSCTSPAPAKTSTTPATR